MTTTINIEDLAEQVRRSLDEAERRLAALRGQRTTLNTEIKEQLEAIVKIRKLAKAVTPREQNGE